MLVSTFNVRLNETLIRVTYTLEGSINSDGNLCTRVGRVDIEHVPSGETWELRECAHYARCTPEEMRDWLMDRIYEHNEAEIG